MIHKSFISIYALRLLVGTAAVYSQSSKEATEAELKGEAAFKSGNFDAAIANFSEAIRLDPKYVVAYSNRGYAFCKRREYAKAIADISEAIRLDPKCAATYWRRGMAFFDINEIDKAIADYSDAIRLDPKYVDAYIDRANAYGIKGDYDMAMTDAAESLRISPKSAVAQNTRGVTYDRCAQAMLRADAKAGELLFDRLLGHIEGPPKKLDDAQEQLPFDGSVEHFRAAARKLERTQKAQLLFDYSAAAFKSAIDIRSDYDFANSNLGVYYARPGARHDAKRAEKYFRVAVKSNPRYADAWNNLGIVLAQQGEFDEAIGAHKTGLAVRGDRAMDRNNLCRAYMQKGDLNNALKENTLALKCDPHFPWAWASRAEIYCKLNNLNEAVKCVQILIASDAKSPSTMNVLFSFVSKCREQKRADLALAVLGQAVSASPTVPDFYVIRANAYQQKGDLRRAKQDLENLHRLRPQLPGIQERIDAIQKQLDQRAKDSGRAKGAASD